jgi:hypothetical protein
VSTLIVALWSLGVGAKALAAWRIVRKGLFHRLPIFWAYIVISVARSAVLLCFIGNSRRYADISADSLPMMLLTEAFAITSVFWAVTENFPRWRRPGTISLTALTLIGTAAALLIRTAGIPKDWGYGWAQTWEWALLLQRNVMVAMGVVLLGVRFLLALVRFIPVHSVARRAADVLCIDVAMGVASATLTMWVGRSYPVVAYLAPVLAGITNGVLWAFWLPAASDGRELAHESWRRHETAIDWRGCFVDLIGRIRLQFTERF